jgi:hypothetical protein
MRLLEPLAGVKMSQGHYLTHLIFFVSMFFIDKDINKNIAISAPDSHLEEQSQDGGKSSLLEVLMSHDGLSSQDAKEHELLLFNLLQWSHALSFGLQILMIDLKYRKYYNLA